MSDTIVPSQDLISAPYGGETPAWTVMQVDDSPSNVSLIEGLLARRNDIKLVTATSGYQGIEMARACHPDLILMDIRLFDINGFDALKVLREDVATAHIPVIAISSYAYPNDIALGLKAGFFRYLTKPFKIDVIMAAIDSALELAAARRQSYFC